MAPALDHVDDEMHELNQEADYLDQTIAPGTNGVNGHKHREPSSTSDPDAQAQVIVSLRSQVQDYFGQINELNSKLINAYDRISVLEDESHVKDTSLQHANAKATQLQAELTEHLSALSTGLLVEKANVTSELTRLMEKATEEAARAGEAESARIAIEKDLDDLSAGLFGQANIMVAEARLARARSERKVEETEKALKDAEEIVGLLQTQMQSLQAEKEAADRKVNEMYVVMGKGKWVDRSAGKTRSSIRLLCLHAPYLEFLQFIVHLRTIRPSTQSPPAMTTLLTLPFLARLATEDSEPTIRLDLAPSLNWLTRRSVLAAIHTGQLIVEPMSTTTLLEEFVAPSIPGHSHTHIVCALCGTPVIESSTSATRSPLPSSPTRANSQGLASWGPSFLKTSLAQTISSAPFVHSISRPGTPTSAPPVENPAQVYIFKLETTSSSGLPVSQGSQSKPATVYPLCTSKWCLTRLRTTCSLWAFVRTGIVERIWEEEPFIPLSRTDSPRITSPDTSEVPSTPPNDAAKRPRMGIGALWGTVSRSLSNNPSRTESEKPATEVDSPKVLDSPQTATHPVPPVPPRRLPPPPRHPPLPFQAAPALPARPVAPPPLPKRNRPVPPPPAPRATNATSESRPEAEKEVPHPDVPARSASEESNKQLEMPNEETTQPVTPRPLSPTAVPLPHSEPASPAQVAVDTPTEGGEEDGATAPSTLDLNGEEKTSHEETSTPAEPITTPLPSEATPAEAPALAEVSAPAESSGPISASTPEAASAAVPPPLPRRAANRARPISQQPPAPVSVPETNESSTHVELDTDIKTTDQVVVEDKPPGQELQSPEHHSESSLPINIEEVVDDKQSNGLQSEDERHSVDLVTVSSDVASDNMTADRSREPSDTTSGIEQMDDVSLKPHYDDEEDVRSEELTPGVYVGDISWEERTWKQLVTLREDMFWARIGGLR